MWGCSCAAFFSVVKRQCVGPRLSVPQKCIAMCMDRYMDSWNTVSRAYNSRLQRERANM
uniref:Mitochondrial import inner membrane translocase subunit n=1 Tax=Bubo bubo TaxID=30461 RepID=A0A8C0FU72_BUBBB